MSRALPSMSRSTRPSPFGKRTQDVRSKVAVATKDAIARRVVELNYANESEYLAEVIEVAAHGLDHVQRLHEVRLRAVAGIGQK